MSDRASEIALVDENGNAITSSNPLPVDNGGASGTVSTAATTAVNASATVVTLLPANSARKGATFFFKNDTGTASTLYMKMGTGASETDFGGALVKDGSARLTGAIYTGIITGIWTTANGSVHITET